MITRYRLLIEYDGAPYSGWQRQDDRPSVQGALEAALRAVGEDVVVRGGVQGAGRTDAGVHATGQVAHVDCVRAWEPFKLWSAVNAHLKGERVAVLECRRVADDWHARFSAVARHYTYRIVARRPPLALERGRAWNVKVPLDVAAMNAAAARLLGTHDFSTFRSTECQAKSPVRTLDRLEARSHGQTIEWHVSARSFLHHQVRSLVGSLEWVGRGKWSADDLLAALHARDRAACGPVAPAHGLYLTAVDYDAFTFR